MTRRLALPLALSAALTLGLAACEGSEEEGSSTMRPGENCMGCHEHSGGEHSFSVAGTVFTAADSGTGQSGVVIVVTDSLNRTATLTSNSAGNFYTGSSLTPPLQIQLRVNGVTQQSMSDASSGACNSCHGAGNRIHP